MAEMTKPRSGVGKFFLGSPATNTQISRYNPIQEGIINKSAQMASDRLGSASFDPYERQARQNFSQQTVPGLAERFTNMGAKNSSAFGQQLGNAAAGLESNLATGRADYDQGLLKQLLQHGLTQQFDTIHNKAQPGFLENSANSLASGLKYLPMLLATGGLGGLAAGAGAATGGILGSISGNTSNQNQDLPYNFGETANDINPLNQLMLQLSGQQVYQQPQSPMQQQFSLQSAQNNPLQAILQALSGPKINIGNMPLGRNAAGNNPYSNQSFANANSFETNRRNYINSFNR